MFVCLCTMSVSDLLELELKDLWGNGAGNWNSYLLSQLSRPVTLLLVALRKNKNCFTFRNLFSQK